MTTCRKYMQHIMKLSKSPKTPKHLNTFRSQPIQHKPQKGGAAAKPPPFCGGPKALKNIQKMSKQCPGTFLDICLTFSGPPGVPRGTPGHFLDICLTFSVAPPKMDH